MGRFFRVFFILPSIILILAFTGCATFKPVPISDVPFMERAQTQSSDNLRVTVAALSPQESKRVFGVDIASRNVQPVWVEVENKTDDPYWNFPIRLDPDYYSSAEVAYTKRFRFSPSKNSRMRSYFEKIDFPPFVPPR